MGTAMGVSVTVRHGGNPAGKPFAWSFSKLKNFETCPKRHYEVDILKNFRDESEQLSEGHAVHKALARRLCGDAQLPAPMASYEVWCGRILATPGTILVEQQLAITANYGPAKWFGKDAWFRAVVDVLQIHGPAALVLDWKTGKIVEDSQQLALAACVVFAHYPEVQRILSKFVWLKEDAETKAVYTRDDIPGIWAGIAPRVSALSGSATAGAAGYPPRPGRLCRRYCPVSSCPHHGV
jgi:hypothetical protein